MLLQLSWKGLLFGALQGSILGPMLSSIYICQYIFLYLSNSFTRKAHDLSFEWFSGNHMKANEAKCHILLSTNENDLVNIGPARMQNNSCQQKLGIKTDSQVDLKIIQKPYAKKPVSVKYFDESLKLLQS